MAQASPAVTILADLDTHNVNEFILKPTLQYENIAQNSMGVYKLVEGVKDKYRMTHLKKPKNVLRPKANCKSWDPTVKTQSDVRVLEACGFELNGEMCADEFDEDCGRNLQGAGNKVIEMNATDALDAFTMAAAEVTARGVVDSIYKVAWFADPEFGTANYDYDIDWTNTDADEKSKLTRMMQNCKGLWYDLTNLAEDGKINYVDTNDGTASGNALNPANITDFMDQMILNSNNVLRYYNKNRQRQDWPMFLLQPGLFYAYETYLQSLSGGGVPAAFQLLVDGVPVPGVYTYKGYPVFEIPEWIMFDDEIGAVQDSGAYAGFSKYQRAIFTVKENLTIGFDALPLANAVQYGGTENSGLIVQPSTHVRDKGIIWMYMALRLGAKVAVEDYVTVGYNSSTNYVS